MPASSLLSKGCPSVRVCRFGAVDSPVQIMVTHRRPRNANLIRGQAGPRQEWIAGGNERLPQGHASHAGVVYRPLMIHGLLLEFGDPVFHCSCLCHKRWKVQPDLPTRRTQFKRAILCGIAQCHAGV